MRAIAAFMLIVLFALPGCLGPEGNLAVIAQLGVENPTGLRAVEDHHHAHEQAIPPGDGGGNRTAQLRVWNQSGDLLLSTWELENGSLQTVDGVELRGPLSWPRTEALNGSHSAIWNPLLPMLARAPPNATIRISSYKLGDEPLERLTIQRSFNVDREGVIPYERASVFFGNWTLPGRLTYYLGVIPIRIIESTPIWVRYQFEINESTSFDVPRSVGLELFARPEQDRVNFTLVAPSEGFTAHNNCAAPQKVFETGYYVEVGGDADNLVLDRYGSRSEYLLRNTTIDLELTFFDQGDNEMAWG